MFVYCMTIKIKGFKRKELLGNQYNNVDYWVSKSDAV